MPKLKTNSSAKKRFKITGSGKIRRTQACKQHLNRKKSQDQIRKLRKTILTKNHQEEKNILKFFLPNR